MCANANTAFLALTLHSSVQSLISIPRTWLLCVCILYQRWRFGFGSGSGRMKSKVLQPKTNTHSIMELVIELSKLIEV